MADTLAQLVRRKYPGAYDDLSDEQLEASVDAKYPGVYADIPRTAKMPPEATAGMLPPSEVGKPAPTNKVERFAQQYPDVEVMGSAPIIGPGISAIIGGATKLAPAAKGVIQAALGILDKPVVGAGMGAYQGYRHGGVPGAIEGGIVGAAASKGLGAVTPKAAPAAAAPAATAQSGRLIDSVGDSKAFLDAVNQHMGQRVPIRQAAPAPPANPQASLMQELMDRIQRVDWRTQDAVPIDAMKRSIANGGSILEAGESQIGLGERLAAAIKNAATDPAAAAEAERLARALRQRTHIAQRTRSR